MEGDDGSQDMTDQEERAVREGLEGEGSNLLAVLAVCTGQRDRADTCEEVAPDQVDNAVDAACTDRVQVPGAKTAGIADAAPVQR